MNDKQKALLTQQAPIAVVGAVAVAALLRGTTGAPPTSMQPVTKSQAPVTSPRGADDLAVRSCGKATLVGDWQRGKVIVGSDSTRDTCTVALGHDVHACAAQTSRGVATLTYSSDMRRIVVSGVRAGDSFTYNCE